MKKALLFLTAIMGSILFSNEVRATHVSAAEILYEYTGIPNRWLITLKAYRDCSPGTATMSTTETVCYSSVSSGLSGNITLALLPGSGQVLPPTICVPPGTQFQCYEEYVYQGTVTLPQAATDWKFMWQLCCMNNAINTVQNPGGITFYTESTLNSVVAPTNNSPTFAYIPISRWCLNNQYYYSQGTTEIDGDDIDYQLVTANNTSGSLCPYTTTPVVYINPYSPTNPISTTSGFGFDTQTGVMSFIPNLLQIGLVVVEAREYRNGVQIGSVRRVIQANVIAACANIIPVFTGFQPLPNGMQGINAYCGDTTFILQLTSNVQCGSIVPTDIRVTESTGFPNPVINAQAYNCVNNLTDKVEITVYTPLKNGLSWLYSKVGNDGNTFLGECGSQMPEFDSIPIWTVDTFTWHPVQITLPSCLFNQFSVTFGQLLSCPTIAPNFSDWNLVDASGTNVPISSVTSSCQPGNPLSYSNTFTFNVVTGAYTSPLVLTVKNGTDNNTIANYCGSLLNVGETMAIIDFPTGIPVDLGPDISICAGNPVQIDAGTAGSYIWSLNGTVLPDTTQIITAVQSGTYSVFVSLGGACEGSDSIQVTFIPGPNPNLGPDTAVCITDNYTLNAGFSGGTYQWYLGGALIPGETNQTYMPVVSGQYSVVVTLPTDTCSGTANVNITIFEIPPVPTVTDGSFCIGDPAPILDAGYSGFNYQWFDSGNNPITGANGQTYQPSEAGTFTVVMSQGTCTSQATATVSQISAPIIEWQSTIPIENSKIYLCKLDTFPTLTVTSPTSILTYNWTYNSSPLAGVEESYLVPQGQFGIYNVQITSDPDQCRSSSEIQIVEIPCDPFFPNVITPNFDGFNDYWVIDNFDPSFPHLVLIYNRWGQEVFRSSSYQNNWDGKDYPDGTYFYVVDYNGVTYKGTITKITNENK